MEGIISIATQRNWERLNVNYKDKLRSRANKVKSERRFIPLERCLYDNTEKFINDIIIEVLSRNLNIESVLFSLIINLFIKNKIKNKNSYKKFLDEYSNIDKIKEFLQCDMPENEFDILGTIYQSFLTEGDKNKNGSYYTTKTIIDDMVKDYDLSNGKSFLDPCCGSGAFLLSLKNADPHNIYGIDIDKIAVMLARANLILKYKEYDFFPNIYEANFLNHGLLKDRVLSTLGKFDFIASNPPWGASNAIAVNPIVSGETSSCFFVNACSYLKNGGIISFLMPISILNVRAHQDIRKYILMNGRLESIKIYDSLFSFVTTQYANIIFSKNNIKEMITYSYKGVTKNININCFSEREGYKFIPVENIDYCIMSKIKSKGNLNLRSSSWALGIVTGDNKNKIHKYKCDNEEIIYTGREICAYRLNQAKNYILFDRSNLQQVAKDEFYRAPEKLVYKFISKKLTFAYDNTGALFLNSANILIPKIKNMSIKTVMAFLNTSIFQYLYIKMFNEIKILKCNLMEIPFPMITIEQDRMLSSYIDEILAGNICAVSSIDVWMKNFYNLDDEEVKHIVEVVNGKTY